MRVLVSHDPPRWNPPARRRHDEGGGLTACP
jgi:hypothetical protein